MEGKKYLNLFIKIILVVIFGVGTAGHFMKEHRELMLELTPFVLLITSGLVLYAMLKEKNNALIKWCIGAYLITFFSEVIGVSTGLLFGNYSYGNTLGLKILNVPVIIGLNWILIIAGATGLAFKVTKNRSVIPATAAAIAVIFDYILEPAAVKFNYWQWENNIIPIYNYISWFVIAYIVSYLLIKNDAVPANDVPQNYLGIQAVFFMFLNFV